MTPGRNDLLAAKLEEIAKAAADAIVHATGDESAAQVALLLQFQAREHQLPASDLHHLLRTAEHLHGGEHPELGTRLLRYSRVADRTR